MRAAGATVMRRSRGGMLIQVILGMLLLAGVLAGAYTYYRKGDLDRQIMDVQTRMNVIVWEINRTHGNVGTYRGISMGTYDASRNIYVGGVAGSSQLGADIFRGVTATVASEGNGYCLNVTGHGEEICRMARKRITLPDGFTFYPLSCGEEVPRIRACYRNLHHLE